MSRLTLVLTGCALLVASGIASAQVVPKWTYVEAGFTDFNPDEGASDDGWYGKGSLSLFNNFHILAQYNDVGDYDWWNAGVGWHGLLGEPADLFAEVLWTDVDIGDQSDDGYELSGGVRWRLGEIFEVKGAVNWTDLDEGGDDTTVEAEGLIWLLDDRLGLGLSYEVGDSDTARLFARWAFGR
jgi:hypothetical protein